MKMKGIIIGAVVTVAAVAVYTVKKINDDRRTDEFPVGDGKVNMVRKETFKEAAKRKVNEILEWVANNGEKVDSAVKVISTAATVIGVVSAAVELYSSVKGLKDDTNEKLLKEVDEIRVRLISTAPAYC